MCDTDAVKKISNFKFQISNFKSYSGQTMLEILVALTLIILFLSGIVVVELFAIKNVEYAQNKSLATRFASQQLERVRVIRDTAGIDQMLLCTTETGCLINSQLTPVALAPTGVFNQIVRLEEASIDDCPPPDITPIPVIYKAIANVNWGQGAIDITPAPELTISSCISDWR